MNQPCSEYIECRNQLQVAASADVNDDHTNTLCSGKEKVKVWH